MGKLSAIVAGAFLAMPSGCERTVAEQCIDHSAKHYSRALSRILTANDVANRLKPGEGVCFGVSDASTVSMKSKELNQYFWEVAGQFSDRCEEEAFVAWAEKEDLSFEVFETSNAEGGPSGRRMFVIHSTSAAEVDSNRKKVWNEAPKNVRCAKQN